MRDGIYEVDFKSGRPEGIGIAMLVDGIFKGLDQSHVYYGDFTVREGQLSIRLETYQYSTPVQGPSHMPAAASGRRSVLKLRGKEADNRFEVVGEAEGNPGSRYEFNGKWIADLGMPYI